MGGLTGCAAFLRISVLAPSSLWLDDAWVALVHRADTWGEIYLTSLGNLGFQVILKAWFAVVGFSELRAQMIPFVIGVVTPAFLYVALFIGARLQRSSAAMAAGLLVLSPVLSVYSGRLKVYTLDAALTVMLIWLGVKLWRSPSARRAWIAYLTGAIGATVLSSVVVPVIAGGFAAGLLRIRQARVSAAYGSILSYGAFGASWWVVVIRPSTNDSLHDWWAARDVFVSNSQDLVSAFIRVGQGLHAAPGWGVMGAAAIGFLLLLRRRRDLAVLTGIPLLGAAVLSFAGLLPLGGGRTDAYLLPIVATIIAGGIDVAPLRRWVGWGVIVAVVLVGPLPRVAYPDRPSKAAVQHLAALAASDHGIVVLGVSQFPVGLYWPGEIDLTPEEGLGNGFNVHFSDGRFVIAGERWQGRSSEETVRNVAESKPTWVVSTRAPTQARAIVDAAVQGGRIEVRSLWEVDSVRVVLLAPTT